MKRILSLLITLCMISSVTAASAFSDNFETDAGWSVTSAAPDGHAGAEIRDDGYHVYFDTTSGAADASASAVREFACGQGIFAFSANFCVPNAADGAEKTVTAVKSSLQKAKIFTVKNGGLYCFNSQEEACSIEDGRVYSVFATVNPENLSGSFWLDGKYIGSFVTGFKSVFFGSTMKIEIKNTAKAVSVFSDFVFESVSVESLTEDSGISYIANPADGSFLVPPGEINGIVLEFNSVTAPSNTDKSNMSLSSDGNEIEFTVETDGNKCTVIPINGFEAEKSYVFKIFDFMTVTGESLGEKSVAFSTSNPDYTRPSVEFGSSEFKLYTGETVTLSPEVTSSCTIEKVVYCVDGIEYVVLTEGDYSCEFSLSAGKYNVTAVAYDEAGGSSIPAEVWLEFVKNTAPVITVEGIADGGSYETSDDFSSCTVTAEDAESNLVSLEVSINGNRIYSGADSKVTLDLTAYTAIGENVLEAEAADERGLTDRKTLRYNVDGLDEVTVIRNTDFESSSLDGMNYVLNADGKRSYEYVGDNDTKALVYRGQSVGGDYIIINTRSVKTRFKAYFDIYFDQIPGYAFTYFGTTASEGLVQNVSWTDSVAKFGRNSVEYEAKKWYTCMYEVDFSSRTIRVEFGEKGGKLQEVLSPTPINNDKIVCGDIRLVTGGGGNADEPEPVMIALDNVKVYEYSKPPVITGVGFEGTEMSEQIPPSAESVYVYLTSGLDAAGFTADSVRLTCGDEDILIRNAEFDEEHCRIVITPGQKLISNCIHTVIVKEGTPRVNGVGLSTDLSKSFFAAANDIDAGDIKLVKTQNTCSASGVLINNTDSSCSALAVLTVYSGDRMKAISVTEITADMMSTVPFTSGKVIADSGDTVQFVIIRSAANPRYITQKIYTLR